jgi:hypothetical protein
MQNRHTRYKLIHQYKINEETQLHSKVKKGCRRGETDAPYNSLKRRQKTFTKREESSGDRGYGIHTEGTPDIGYCDDG